MRISRKKMVCAMMDADLNIMQLAEKAGVSRTTVGSIKNGKSCAPATVGKIAEALGVDVTEIIEE